MTFNQRLKALRKYKRLTQGQVAEAIGVTRVRYNAWENGIANPDFKMLAAIARFHGVTVDFLLGFGHPGGVLTLSDDMYADGYTDETFFEELEKELERRYLSKRQNKEKISLEFDDDVRALARDIQDLEDEDRKALKRIIESMKRKGQ
ncbi:helix-turn-helix transcriptional regulator [Paenibacillus larvae]|uniref:Helix-turn-helix family protein n=1 Tax=Paenibacillus larvae subsp. larvae TaxID=147375 RepID=A0A6C0QUA7_9BACL|nr:helix-turn-helix transcriptional regulator [Paenibacillus larvae]QHZ52203.1 helix-turn-helix family protein [Paenibacillus larvae subsp. larvae]